MLSGGTPSKAKSSYWKGDIPWVSCKDMKTERLLDSEDHLSHEGAAHGTRMVTPGTVLIVVRGMILAKEFPIAIAKRPLAFNQDLKALKCAECLDDQFLFYWLKSKTYDILGIADEAAHGTKRLQTDRLQSLEIGIPPRLAQKAIVSVLSAYDDLIENNTRRIRILEEMAQMLYREWFINFRLPGHEMLRTVESESGPIPEGWSMLPLEAVCTRITDGSHWSPPTVASTHRMASSKDMHRWGLNLSTARTIANEDFDSLVRNDCKPLAGDLLITKDGANYLKYCFVIEKDIDVVLLSSIAMVRPAPERMRPHYLAFHLAEPSVKMRLAGRVSGAAIPRIVLKDFRHFTVLVPPSEIQDAFERLVQPVVGLCWRLTDKNTNLRTTRDLLLPKLISGEIPVEATAELLEQTA
jgi:type I restriction enzyme S subunit